MAPQEAPAASHRGREWPWAGAADRPTWWIWAENGGKQRAGQRDRFHSSNASTSHRQQWWEEDAEWAEDFCWSSRLLQVNSQGPQSHFWDQWTDWGKHQWNGREIRRYSFFASFSRLTGRVSLTVCLSLADWAHLLLHWNIHVFSKKLMPTQRVLCQLGQQKIVFEKIYSICLVSKTCTQATETKSKQWIAKLSSSGTWADLLFIKSLFLCPKAGYCPP